MTHPHETPATPTDDLLAALVEAVEAENAEDEADEDDAADGVFEDEDCTVRIDNEEVLPATFYYRRAGTVTWYEYAGDEQYECRELCEDRFGHPYFLQTANDRVGDEVTAEIFLMINDPRYDEPGLADLVVYVHEDEDEDEDA